MGHNYLETSTFGYGTGDPSQQSCTRMPDDVSGVQGSDLPIFIATSGRFTTTRYMFPLVRAGSMTSRASILQALTSGWPCSMSVFRALAQGGPLRRYEPSANVAWRSRSRNRLSPGMSLLQAKPCAYAPRTACFTTKADIFIL